MKLILHTVAVFTLAITALHAQVLPGSVPPTLKPSIDPTMQAAVEPAVQAAVDSKVDPAVQAAVASTVNPAVQAAIDTFVPHAYAGVAGLCLVTFLFFSRVWQGRKNKLSWLDSIAAAVNGTNVPSKLPLLIACLALLTLPSCSTMKKIGAALSTPQAQKVELALLDIGMHVALADGVITPGDLVTIGNGVAVITSGDTTISKTVKLAKLGLDTAEAKGVVKPGDTLLIKESTAILTQAITPVEPITPPPAAATASGK